MLQRALAEAQRDGVSGPEVRRARDALLALEAGAFAQQADAEIERAIRADDCWKLQAALQRMVSFGASGDQVARATEAMKEQRRRQGHEMAIAQAAAARDAPRLRTAIEKALKAYAAQADVKRAREMLRAIEAQAAAKEMLRGALVTKEPADLRAALAEALRSGLHQAGPGSLQMDPQAPELVAACRGALGQQTVMRLQQLYDDEDVEGLRQALAEASGQAEKGSRTMADFHHKLSLLESRHACRQVLQEAAFAGEASKIAAALQSAESAGVGEADLLEARKALAEAREREKDAAARDRAAQELRMASSSDDAGRVEKALVAAEASGLAGPETAHARERLRQMRGRTGAARELSEAASSGDVYRLRAALATARSSGVGEKELKHAQSELQRLKDQAHARRSLDAAVASGDAQYLRSIIEEAKRLGVHRQEIGRAEAAAREMCQTQVGRELTLAIASSDLERLRSAARAATDAGVASAELDAAWERIRELESHEWLRRQLHAAAASGDAARLQAAIKQAEAGGLDISEVEAARSRLDVCHARLRAQQEQQLVSAAGYEPTATEKRTVPATMVGGPLAATPTPISNAMRQGASAVQATMMQQPGVGQYLQPRLPVAPQRVSSVDSVATAPRELGVPGTVLGLHREPTTVDARKAVRWAA